jgi:hypothetical protein
MSCGGGSDLGGDDLPQAGVDFTTPTGVTMTTPGVIPLRTSSVSDRPETQTKVLVGNSGEIPIKIKDIELLDTPNRLVPIGNTNDTDCEYSPSANRYAQDGACSTGQFCWYQTGTCRAQGFPETPIEVKSNRQKQFEFVVQPGDGNLSCSAEPPSNLPSAISEDAYCGRLRIRTNAEAPGLFDDFDSNTNRGTINLFFVSNQQASETGRIEVSPSTLTFDGIQAGGSQTKTIQVKNTGNNDLRIFNMTPSNQPQLFTVDGPSFPHVISSGATKSWDVTLSPPADWSDDQINSLGPFLEIETTATNVSGGQKPVPISVSTQSKTPIVEIDPATVSFASRNNRTLTITNKGSIPVVLRSVTTNPSNAAQFYTYKSGDQIIEDGFGSTVLEPDASQEMTVNFDSSAGDAINGVGELEITYSYSIGGGEQRTDRLVATLTSNIQDKAIGLIDPTQFSFAANGNDSQTRTFVFRNVGDQPLTINGASGTENSPFSTGNLPGSVPAGGLAKGTITFENSGDSTAQSTVAFDTNTGGAELDLFLLAQQAERESSISAEISPQFSGSVSTGEAAVFTGASSNLGQEGNFNSARWLLTSRPSGSKAFVDRSGETAAVIPDVAGSYEITLLIADGNYSAQATHEFTVE